MLSVVHTSEGWVVRYENGERVSDSEPYTRMLDASARLEELRGAFGSWIALDAALEVKPTLHLVRS